MFCLDPLCLHCGLECGYIQKEEATTKSSYLFFLSQGLEF